MDSNNMDRHQSPEGLNNPLPDIDRGENTRIGSEENSETKSIINTENYGDSRFAENFIPNHHSNPVIKLEALDHESYGGAKLDGKETTRVSSVDPKCTDTCERTEFGLRDLEQSGCETKNVSLKTDMDVEKFDSNGPTPECVEEQNRECDGKSRQYSTSSTDVKTQNAYENQCECDVCGQCSCMQSFHTLHPCDTCELPFKGKQMLEYHKLSHKHERESRDFCCANCGYICKSVDSFQTHIEIHRDESRPYTCDVCGKMFTSVSGLGAHLRDVNDHAGNYRPASIGKCKLCENTFKTEGLLQKHMESFHAMHSCDICGQNIPGKRTLGYHKLAHDHETKSHDFCCDTCGEIYRTVDSFRTHLELHTDEDRPFRCDICGKTFLVFHMLQKHIRRRDVHTDKTSQENKELTKCNMKQDRTTHQEQQKCDVCGKYYPGIERMKQHMKCHTRIKNFSCDVCVKRFVSQEGLKCHMKIHQKLIKCDICGRCFACKRDLRTHMRIHNRPASIGKCEICDKTLKTEHFLQRHMNSFHVMHSCDICGQNIPGKRILDYHQLAHEHERKSRDFCCDTCGEIYKTVDSFRTHLELHMDEDRPFRCDICGKDFLVFHMLRKHLREKNFHTEKTIQETVRFSCDICGKSYNENQLLEKHMDYHKKKELFTCETCGKRYAYKYSLKKHLKTHTIQIQITLNCEKCDQTFKTEYALQNHTDNAHTTKRCDICGEILIKGQMKNHMSNVHTTKRCDICGKELIKGDMKQHMASHQEQHKCDVCGKYYSGIERMKQHMKCHTRIKNFSCDVCVKRFVSQEGLKCHMKIHQKLIKCDICGHCFMCKRDLRTHMRIHNRPFGKCEICDKTLKTEHFLQRHMNSFHVMHSCDICGQNIPGKRILDYHQLAHEHERKSRDFCCDTCGEIYKTVDSFRTHLELHTDEDRPFRCDICGKDFLVFYMLQRHIRRSDVHTDKTTQENKELTKCDMKQNKTTHQEQQKCDVCGKYYPGIERLERHMKCHTRIKKFSCDVCGKRYMSQESLRIHMRFHQKTIKCDICGRCFAYKRDLRTHMRIHNRPASIGKCEICDKTFKTERILQRHINTFHNTNSCDICGLKFKENLQNHLNRHHISNVCDICGRQFDGEVLLQYHKFAHNHEKGALDFRCHKCENIYKTVDAFHTHLKLHRKEEGSKQFQCEICGKEFLSFRRLRSHINIHRKEIETFCNICSKRFTGTHEEHILSHEMLAKCEVCGRCFRNEISLNKHKELHSRVELKCEQCNWMFTTKQRMQKHMERFHKPTPCDICGQELTCNEMNLHKNMMHPQDYICDVCGQSCSGLSKLRMHLETHPTKNVKLFRCDICCKTCTTEVGLHRHHRMIHSEARRNTSAIICDKCGKGFSSKRNLFTHLFTHRPKPHKCNTCGKMFSTKSTFLNHVYCRRQCQTCGKKFIDKKLFKKHVELHVSDGSEGSHGNGSLNQPPCIEPSCARTVMYRKHPIESSNPRLDVGDSKKTRGSVHVKFTAFKITSCRYKCRLCYKRFQKKTYLETHKKWHHRKLNVRKFKCNMCIKTFTSNFAMKTHSILVHSKKPGKKNIRLKKHTSTHKEKRKGQNSRTECIKTIDSKHINLDDMQVNIPKGKHGHWRESKLPYLKPREISEDSILLTKREILKFPPKKRDLINDETNFLSMVIRKSVNELELDSMKAKQYTKIITKVKELVLNKNLDEANIKSVLKRKVTESHKYWKMKKRKLTEITETT